MIYMHPLMFQSRHARSTDNQRDGALLTEFLFQHDDSAFAELMNRHGAMLYAMARRQVHNPADAEDLCQTAFLLLARKASHLTHLNSIAGWLLGALRRLAADLRKMQTRRVRHEHASVQLRPEPMAREAESLVRSQEMRQKIDDVLATLPARYREPLLLCYWEGLSKSEATARLGWKPGTLSGRLARGKALLKARLERRGILPAVTLAWLGGAGLSQALPVLPSMALLHFAATSLRTVKPHVSPATHSLLRGVSFTMSLQRYSWTAAALLLIGTLTWLGIGLNNHVEAREPQTAGLTTVQAAPSDQDILQGRWHCVAAVVGGRSPDGARQNINDLRDNMWFEFIGDTAKIGGSPAEKEPIKYRLTTNTHPKQIHFEAGPFNLHGIYSLNHGVLLVRFGEGSTQGTDLPKSFDLTDNSTGALFVLQKTKLKHLESDAAKKPLGGMAGSTNALSAQEYTGLTTAQTNMKRIAIAVHNYANDHGHLPTNVYDKNGKAILSWRVKLLPYLERDNIMKKFKIDEPWDSAANKELLQFMPPEYQMVVPGKPTGMFTTPYRAFSGPGTLHEAGKTWTFPQIIDGLSNTFLFVESAEEVPWSKPDDLPYDRKQPFPKVGGRFGDCYYACMCDGSVRPLKVHVNANQTETPHFKMITPAGRELIEHADWDK